MPSVASRLSVGSMLLAATLAAPLAAQDATARAAPVAAYRARLLGVFDEASGEPLAGVRVLDVLNGNSAQTTRTGTVSLAFLPDGGSLVRLQKIGYATQTLTVKISPADTTPVTVMLAHVTELPKVVTRDAQPSYISPNLRGFQERMKTENGYFIDDSTLRKNEGRPLANLLSTKPGVIIARGMSSSAYLQRSPRCNNGLPPEVYLDGVPLTPTSTFDPAAKPTHGKFAFGGGGTSNGGAADPSQLAFNLSEFNISDLAGVEWYPDGEVVPVEFSHTSDRCGVLLLWTREK